MNIPKPTYSQIISPEDYNKIMSQEHLYISLGDRAIKEFIEEEVSNNKAKEVVELGCGPARIITLMSDIPDIKLTGIDHDASFIDHAKKAIKIRKLNINIKQADVVTYIHENLVDIFYSQGFHHHIKKGKHVELYLQNLHKQLKDGGVYILADEILAEYKNNAERLVNAVIWYSHIISSAKKSGFNYLAQEEAKTLLDDINESNNIKTKEQIELVLNSADVINNIACSGDIKKVRSFTEGFLNKFQRSFNTTFQGDETLDLSRGDYKICESELVKEIEEQGFKLQKSKTFGPGKGIGSMSVYLFRKIV